MKTVNVTFDDGSTRDWPAKERLVHSNEIPPQPPRVELEPIDDDEWEFYPVIGGWRCRKRHK
jgi:hypothetical protein